MVWQWGRIDASSENTLESLRHALSLFDGIEFDIRITADHQLIIHHDRTVSIRDVD